MKKKTRRWGVNGFFTHLLSLAISFLHSGIALSFLFFLSIVSVSTILALARRGIYYFWITDDRSRVRTRIALLCTKDVKMYKHKGK
jgi:hypothetical protein